MLVGKNLDFELSIAYLRYYIECTDRLWITGQKTESHFTEIQLKFITLKAKKPKFKTPKANLTHGLKPEIRKIADYMKILTLNCPKIL